MKNISFAFLLIFLAGCSVEELIEYPDDSEFGPNILSVENDSLPVNTELGIYAELPRRTDLDIIISGFTTFCGTTPCWEPSDLDGWDESDYAANDDFQRFLARDRKPDGKIVFTSTGRYIIQYYKNGISAANSKTLTIY